MTQAPRSGVLGEGLATGRTEAYRSRCEERDLMVPRPGDIHAYPPRLHATADRLNVREPSRAPTETGSLGEYDPVLQLTRR